MKKLILFAGILFLPSAFHGFSQELKIFDVTNNNIGAQPSIARNSNGEIFVIYKGFYDEYHDIELSKSTDGGNTFTNTFTFQIPTGDTIRYPAIKIDNNNRIHIAYIYKEWSKLPYKLFYRVSEDNGKTFSAPVQVSSMSVSSLSVPEICTYEDNVYIIWDSDNGNICFNKSIAGGQFDSSETILSNSFSINPCITSNEDGAIFAAWQAMDASLQYHIYFTKSVNQGLSFDSPKHIDNNTSYFDDRSPHIATYKNIIYVTWKYLYIETRCKISKSTDNGMTFSPSITINTSDASDSGSPQIAIDSCGFVHTAWTDYRNSSITPDIYYAVSTDSATSFSANIKVNSLPPKPGYGNLNPKICLDDNYAYITWNAMAYTDNLWNIYFSKGKAPVTAPAVCSVALSSTTIQWSWIDNNNGLCQEDGYRIKDINTGALLATLPANTTYWLQSTTANTYNSICLETFNDTSASTSTACCFSLAVTPSGAINEDESLHSITLCWEGNNGTSFRIDRAEAGESWVTIVDSGTPHYLTRFKDENLKFATTYYYAIYGYNGNNIITLSSCTTSGATKSLPDYIEFLRHADFTAQEQKITDPVYGTITVSLPAQTLTEDGYISINVDADVSPKEIAKENLDIANNNLSMENNKVLTDSIVEINMYDITGSTISDPLSGYAILSLPYTDTNNDGYLDGANSSQLKTESLRIFSLNKTSLRWELVAGEQNIDTLNKTISVGINHFSIYALVGIGLAESSLQNVTVYPNPYSPSKPNFGDTRFGKGIVFNNLTGRATIKVFTISGELVREFEESDGDGMILWDTKNSNGEYAASGIYLYLITNPEDSSQKTRGKIAIIR